MFLNCHFPEYIGCWKYVDFVWGSAIVRRPEFEWKAGNSGPVFSLAIVLKECPSIPILNESSYFVYILYQIKCKQKFILDFNR